MPSTTPKETVLLDGQLYSRLLPADLRDLAMPPIHAPEHYRAGFEKHFNRRARWRLVRHSAPDQDGATRWRCPFCAGLLRSRSFPRTMRGSRNAPLVFLPEGTEKCCCGTVTAPAADLPLAQRIPFGTTASRISMNRRMAVESVNAAFKGGFVNVAKGFVRTLGLTKITVFLSFTVAAVNLDRIRSFEAKRAEEEKVVRRHRRRRRVGTLTALIGPPTESVVSTAAPPG